MRSRRFGAATHLLEEKGDPHVNDKIDWEALAREMGLLLGTGADRKEAAGRNDARAALDQIIGHGAIRDAVDRYVADQPGSELARAVLRLFRSAVAMERCHEIFRESSDVNRRRSAVELLRMVADGRALEWVPEFLSDPDEGIQNWAIGVVDQLMFADLVGLDECQSVLALAAKHPSAYVRDMARSIRDEAQRSHGDGPEGRPGGGAMGRRGGGGNRGGGAGHRPPTDRRGSPRR
jgi:hypothetical protein